MYNGIIIIITLDVLNNFLAQRWPPKMSEIAVYTVLELVKDQKESHFCRIWNGILYSPNYYSISNPIPLPFNDLTAIIRYGFQQPQFRQDSDSLVKMQAAETLLPRSHAILI